MAGWRRKVRPATRRSPPARIRPPHTPDLRNTSVDRPRMGRSSWCTARAHRYGRPADLGRPVDCRVDRPAVPPRSWELRCPSPRRRPSSRRCHPRMPRRTSGSYRHRNPRGRQEPAPRRGREVGRSAVVGWGSTTLHLHVITKRFLRNKGNQLVREDTPTPFSLYHPRSFLRAAAR
jgi:hypothetical protein